MKKNRNSHVITSYSIHYTKLYEIDPVVPDEQAPRMLTEANAFLVREALHSAIYGGSDRGLGNWMGTGWRAAKELKRKDLAGKTGTTNEAKDAWFSGFAPTVVATAWVGFDDHRRALGRSVAGTEFGASAAQPIVITSYIIHYTKLYEETLLCCRSCWAGSGAT